MPFHLMVSRLLEIRVLHIWSNQTSVVEFGYGELAQLVERCDRTAEVRGSNPLFSMETALSSAKWLMGSS